MLLAVISLCFWAKRVKTESESKPTLAVVPSEIDFGDVLQFHEKKFSVALCNNDASAVEIVDIKPSCGCTTATLTDRLIEPGKTARLSGTISPSSAAGPFRVQLIIAARLISPAREYQAKLILHGVGRTLFSGFAQVMDLGELDVRKPPVIVTRTIYRGDEKLSWDDLAISGPHPERTRVRKVDADTFLMSYAIDARMVPVGVFRDEIIVQPRKNGEVVDPGRRIEIAGRVISDVSINPSILFLGLVNAKVKKGGTFEIKTTNRQPLKLLSVEHPADIALNEIGGSSGKIIFSYSGVPRQAGDRSGKILIHISTSEPQTLNLPFIEYVE